jgi:dipeptidyl aminopeptidase/acylaminoacyl peptidase
MTTDATAYLDALLALPGLRGQAVSPDGRWVAWSWSRVGPVADVYVAPTDGSAAPIRLTDLGENTSVSGWSPDSRAVLVAHDRGGDERARLLRVDLDSPLAPTLLTDAEPDYFLRGGALTPDGAALIYGANYDFAAGREIEATWIYRHDLSTGARVPIARRSRPGGGWPLLNSAGTHVLYTRRDRHPAGTQVWLVGSDGAGDRELFNFGDDVKCAASWFPDGRRVLVRVETPTHTRLGLWTLGDCAPVRWLLDDPARNIESAYVPHGSERIVLIDVCEAHPRASFLDPTSGDERPWPAVPGQLVPLAPTPAGAWVAFHASSRQPADLVRTTPGAAPESFVSLTRLWERTTLRPADFTPAEDFRWTAPDGLPIQGWLYRPGGESRGTIVYVHGGPTSHSRDQLNPELQYFARLGFTVLDPNYRGSTGFGLAFREAIKEDGWGGREQDDIRAGIAALLAAGIAQPGRVGITGTSYGGYSSWCGITRWDRETLAAAAPICGMTDLVVDYETTRPDLRPYSEEMLGGTPETAPERYRERSPIHAVDRIGGALLIVQGARDPNVTPENVRAIRAALDATTVPYDTLEFADEGHGIARPANQRILYTRLAEFFAASFSE